MTETISLCRPDDWHTHLRTGAVLRAVLPYTAKTFARAIVMPNLSSPITHTERAIAYRHEIEAALPKGADFTPLMTLYLADTTAKDDLEQGYKKGVLTAAKLYPAHTTTNAEAGVSNIKKIFPVLEVMQNLGMPLLVHGEVADPDVDIFDREKVFIDRVLIGLQRDFPELKIVFEHITTKDAAFYVREQGKKGKIAATVTAHHLWINRNAIFEKGLRPHFYCLPVAKREEHRLALIEAATSGEKMFFLGTDTAPHTDQAKECACGSAGIFSAPHALALYAQVFEEAGKMQNLEAFASLHGPAFYGLPINKTRITLQKKPPQEIKPILTEEGQKITLFNPSTPLLWHSV